jgi:hypothetical protein
VISCGGDSARMKRVINIARPFTSATIGFT